MSTRNAVCGTAGIAGGGLGWCVNWRDRRGKHDAALESRNGYHGLSGEQERRLVLSGWVNGLTVECKGNAY